jgi:hypothetical protein
VVNLGEMDDPEADLRFRLAVRRAGQSGSQQFSGERATATLSVFIEFFPYVLPGAPSSAQPDRQPTKIPPEQRILTRFVDVITFLNKYYMQIGVCP